MAASSAGALKAFIEGLGLGISVYRDRAPEKTALPYVSIAEAVAVVPDLLEDGLVSTGRETVTIDVWMTWKNKMTGAIAEAYALPGAILRGLHGRSLPASPTHTYAVIIQRMGPRLVEEETNLVHCPLTAVLWREL
jgi:galactitol-specific phosphotransferase system IIC component